MAASAVGKEEDYCAARGIYATSKRCAPRLRARRDERAEGCAELLRRDLGRCRGKADADRQRVLHLVAQRRQPAIGVEHVEVGREQACNQASG